jgi:hypothetical protein
MKTNFFHKKTKYDGRPILEIKSFADLEELKRYRDRKEDVRIVIKPENCTDNYSELLKAIEGLVGNVKSRSYLISLKDHIKN